MAKTCWIIRGVQGSGKSTLSKQIQQDLPGTCVICSADNFFINADGNYRFAANRLPEAHKWCRNVFDNAILAGNDTVILDNTNIFLAHFLPYIDFAKKYGYEVKVVEPNTPWKYNAEECFKRNAHGVPLATIQKMISNFEKYQEQ